MVAAVLLALLFVFAGSVYAASNGGRRGDANGDGEVNAQDLIDLRKYLANYDYDQDVAVYEICESADFDKDGRFGLTDLVAFRKYLANVDSNFVDIADNNGTANVLGVNGLEYTATGYSAVEDGKFVINTGFEIVFDDGLFDAEFNRLSFNYESTEPLQVFITYTLDGEEKTDYFFLEAGKSSFRGLIEGYIYGNLGAGLNKITVDTCEEVEALFVLRGLESEEIPVYDDDLTVENDRYKIGVRLSWGGAMTYFEDKLDGDDELANLVNIHDTGRLIQQSFYGTYTNSDGYVSVPNGGEGATLWPYNPVQGGDRKNNGSDRLIDVEYDEEKDYIYIVSQSLDWAYVKGETYDNSIGYNGLTYTYYVNRYTIMEGKDEGTADDYVLVDNVMTDFSGWTHPAGGQEIPAVYLISYFDTLSYYNGIKPWTGDMESVYYEAELQGWSNAKNFPLYKGNTETWSIWLNTTETEEGGEDFGFGTYCPNIQKHIAIRHQYDGSKDPMANSTSYVAPSCSIVMQSYKPIEYSYILATGSFDQIRSIFTENKDFTTNSDLSEDRYDQLISYGKFDMMNMDFSVESNANIFYAPKHLTTSYDSAEQALKLQVDNSNDPYVALNFDWNSDKVITAQDDFNTIEITYMLPVTNAKSSDTLVLFLSAGDQSDFEDAYSVKGTIVRDGEYHTLSIRIPKNKCSGEMHKIRFDAFNQPAVVGDVMYIKSIRFTTEDYPEIAVENDMTVENADKLVNAQQYTTVYHDKTQNAIALEVFGGTDVYVYLDFSTLNLSTEEYYALEIEYMLPTTNSIKNNGAGLYYSTSENKGFTADKCKSIDLIRDGQYHIGTFDLSEAAFWTGTVGVMRFDYFNGGCSNGDVMYIKSIRFIKIPQYEIDISADQSGKCFESTNYTNVSFDEDEEALLLQVSGGKDVNVIMDLKSQALSTDEYTKLFVRYMIPTTNSRGSYVSTVYFATDTTGGYNEASSVYMPLVADGQYHTVIFNLSEKATWDGIISKLRFDYFQGDCVDGDVMYIESIALG